MKYLINTILLLAISIFTNASEFKTKLIFNNLAVSELTESIEFTNNNNNLSISNIDAIDWNGGLLMVGDIIVVTIEIVDANNEAINDLQVKLNLPDNIDSFIVNSIPNNSIDSSDPTEVFISNIDVLATNSAEIVFQFTTNNLTDKNLLLNSEFSINSDVWNVDGPFLMIF